MRLSEVQRGSEGYHRMSPPQGPCATTTVWPDWRTSRRRALWQSSRTRDRQGGVRTTAWLSSGSGCLSFLVLAVYRCMRRRLAMAAAPVIMALTWKSPSAGSLPLPKGCLTKEDWPHARPRSQMWRCHRTEERLSFHISRILGAIGALTRCLSMPLRLTNTLRRVGGGAFARASRRALSRVRGRLL